MFDKKEYSREYRNKNKEKLLRQQREWRIKNRAVWLASLRRYSLAHKQQFIDYRRANKKHILVKNRDWRKRVRFEVLNHYSGGNLVCACCGENHIEFLSLDHISGGGNKHRKELRKNGTAFYYWIRKNKFPSGYQVLCFNCNFSKGHYGYCPHQQKGSA